MVAVALTKIVLVAKRLVEVALVKTPVDGVVAPIAVLLIVPPEIVRALSTIGSVTLLAGKDNVDSTVRLTRLVVVAKRLVEVRLVATRLVGLKLVAVNVPAAKVPK